MSLIKKIFFLLVVFIGFIIYSVYSFNYDSKEEGQLSSVLNTQEMTDTNDSGLIDKIINIFASSDTKEYKPFSIVLTKKDGMLIMDGTFANNEDVKKVSNILSINRDGNYIYKNDIAIDETLLSKVALLVTPIKDFFSDDVKLSILNNEVTLTGELKDPNHFALLESIVSRMDIDLVKDIRIANPDLVSDELNREKDTNLIYSNVNKDGIPRKVLSLNDIQDSINKILLEKKIAFERKSSIITEDSNSVIIKIAKILHDNKNVRVEISGHTDSRGEKQLNKQISQDRASSVMEALINLGINKDRLTAIGYGEEFPIAKDDENGLSEINRRVEFKVIGE
jgi:outer membrane protein OmpA-like peptidoglycan-associated protein